MPAQNALRSVVCWLLVPLLLIQETSFAGKNQTVDEMKAAVSKVGAGKKARVIVRMKDATVLKGYIRESTDEGFTLVAKQKTQTVAYRDVAQVKKKDINPAVMVAIVVGAVVGIAAIIMLAKCGTGGCS